MHAPALCLPRGRRLVVTSGHCAGTYLIPFYLEGGEYHDCMCALREVAFRDSLPLRVSDSTVSMYHGMTVSPHPGAACGGKELLEVEHEHWLDMGIWAIESPGRQQELSHECLSRRRRFRLTSGASKGR